MLSELSPRSFTILFTIALVVFGQHTLAAQSFALPQHNQVVEENSQPSFSAGNTIRQTPIVDFASTGSTTNTWTQEAGAEPAAANAGAGSADAAAANNPGAPLSQIQIQNVFIPETYDGSGYSNEFVVQPVIAINNRPGSYFKYHIIRATFPVLSPISDPDGPTPPLPGIADTTVFDLYFPESRREGVSFGYGPIAILPTADNPGILTGERQTGLGEWQLGPAAAYINASREGWVFGGIVQVPFSLESDAYAFQFQPILTKLLKDDKYIAIGDRLLKLDDQNGNYNIPLSVKVGKVFKFGKQPINIFFQPEYTPRGLTSQSTSIYGFKISVSILLPGARFGYDPDSANRRALGLN